VSFDSIEVADYPYWHGTLEDLQNNLNDISARYNKDMVVVETAYAFTADNSNVEDTIGVEEYRGYPFTPEGLKCMLQM